MFGSQVAGTADGHSDVDITVELTEAAREDAPQVRPGIVPVLEHREHVDRIDLG